ncbi:MAG TPA: hypothetical protein VEQ41_08465 [Solirubrobacterales bacterium]|nr:hypothetical protein [Solirubrobacterales bacterium]
MREKLNENPLMQVALVGVLLVATGFFVLSSMGGGAEEEAGSTEEAPVGVAIEGSPEAAGSVGAASVPALPPGAAAAAPPPPPAVVAAFDSNKTVVLLFVRNGGIDDRLVRAGMTRLRSLPRVAPFIVPASRISRYASIAQGVAVDRVPALVVVRPKRLARDIPSATVSYGFRSPQSIAQAVIDAGYKGRTLDYHP